MAKVIFFLVGLSLLCDVSFGSIDSLRELVSVIRHSDQYADEVMYGKHLYTVKWAKPIVLAYLSTHYKQESAEQWLNKYCYRTKSGRYIRARKYGQEWQSAKDILNKVLIQERINASA